MERGRRATQRHDVHLVVLVVGHHGGDDLQLLPEVLGKHRSDGPIDEPADQRAALAGASFALEVTAERLRKSLRSCDIIGRPGGDEFVALVPDVTGDVAEKLATRLTRALEEPYLIGTQKLLCAASIGLALYPDNASTLTGLLREADQAMYRAKARCRDAGDEGVCNLLEKAM